MDDDDMDDQSDDDGEFDADDEGGFTPPTHVFFENEPLIRALNDPRRGENDPDLAKRLFGAIVDSTLISLVPDEQELASDESGELDLEGDIELSFVLVRHDDVDGDIVPMFTDEGALQSFMPEGGRYVALAVRDLFPLLGSGEGPPNVVINPGGDEALLLTPRMVQDIVDAVRGYGTDVIPAGEQVAVAPAEDPMPDGAVEALRTLLRTHRAVLRCSQVQWFMPSRHETPSLVLAVELDPDVTGDARRFALASLWRDVSPLLRTLDRHVEMVDLDGQREVVGDVVADVEPFYERSDEL